MTVFVLITLVSFAIFALSFLAFDDIDLGDALDFTDDGSSGWFSLRAILLFGLGFGSAGALLTSANWTPLAASAAGVAYGSILYFVGVMLAQLMMKQESSSLKNMDDFRGTTGIVTVPLRRGHIGAVRISTSKGTMDCPATGIGETSADVGESVVVTGVSGSMLMVKKEAA